MDEFFKKHPACKAAINAAAAKANRGAFDQALARISFLDADDASAVSDADLQKRLRALGFPELGSGDFMASTLNEHVGPGRHKPWRDEALTNPNNHTVYYSGDWDSLTTGDETMMHEVLHDLFQGDHKTVAEGLELSTKGDEGEIPRRINDYLKASCH